MKVVGSNPSTVYWMDIFSHILKALLSLLLTLNYVPMCPHDSLTDASTHFRRPKNNLFGSNVKYQRPFIKSGNKRLHHFNVPE